MSISGILSPKRLACVAFALATLGAGALEYTAANAANAPGAATLDAMQTVTDVAGRTVKIPANPQRILLGESRLLMAVALLEGQHPLANIVGWQGDLQSHDPQTFNAYAAKFPQIRDIPLIGGATEGSVSDEKALSLKPDLAIFTYGGEGPGRYNALVKQLEATGTAVVFVDFRIHPMQNTLPSVKLLGEVLHRNDEANAYIRFYSDHLAHVRSLVSGVPEAQRPKVFIDLLAGVWGPCCHTAGNGSFGEFISRRAYQPAGRRQEPRRAHRKAGFRCRQGNPRWPRARHLAQLLRLAVQHHRDRSAGEVDLSGAVQGSERQGDA
jgi:iron complex transport system substrate-binding protein